jgi:hypothetical protein
MSTSTVNDAAWQAYPFTWRNNRGCAYANGQFIRFGIPEPQGKKETDDALKGSDRIGFTEIKITSEMVGKTVAIFTSIEVKGAGDILKSGQIKWFNFILDHGGRAEIWKESADGTIEIIKDKIE